MPYYNAYAYKQIQKLYSGEYKWSSLVGAWIGREKFAALGVPARFTDPDAPPPPREDAPPDPVTKNEEKIDSNKATVPQVANKEEADRTSAPPTSQPATIATPTREGEMRNVAPATVTGPGIEPGKAETQFDSKGSSSSSVQQHVPTTSAIFALSTNATTLGEPTLGNTKVEPVPDVGNSALLVDATTTPSEDPLGPPTAPVGVLPTPG